MSTLDRKRRLGAIWRALSLGAQGPRVLLYHSIGPHPLETSPADFAGQLDWLARGFQIVDIETALSASRAAAARTVVITFDDGYASLRHVAMPRLAAFGATATAYLNTGWISHAAPRSSSAAHGHYPDQRFLTWEQVRQLRAAGWTIGSHGVDHVDLTRLPPDRLHDQLERSRSAIADELGAPCRHFAYTWGRHDAVVRRAVAGHGYRSAAAGHHGVLGPSADRFAFARINVASDWTLDDFAAVMRGDWDYLGWLQRGRLAASGLQVGRHRAGSP